MSSVLRTKDDAAALVARLGAAVVMFPHGAQKVLGWFGGPGLHAAFQMFTTQLHVPPFFAGCAIAAEFLGSIALFLGLFSRLAAAAIGVEMIVAVWLVHWQNGFFMNWLGTQKGEGFEYHLLLLALLGVVLIRGGGRLSLDLLLARPPAERASEPRRVAAAEPLTVYQSGRR